MHSAPAVSFPVGRPRIVGRVALFLWFAGVACFLATVENSGATWRTGVLVGVLLTVGAGAARHFRRAPAGILCFDGHRWSISGAGPAGQGRLQVCLDLQSSMLVRLEAVERRPRWLWVEGRADIGAWRALRRAVYSRAPTAAEPGEPGSAPASGSRPSAIR